jgi:hypothetical protein
MLRPLSSSTILLEEQYCANTNSTASYIQKQFYHANAGFTRKKSL